MKEMSVRLKDLRQPLRSA